MGYLGILLFINYILLKISIFPGLIAKGIKYQIEKKELYLEINKKSFNNSFFTHYQTQARKFAEVGTHGA